MEVQAKIHPGALNTLINRAKDVEEKLYNDLGKYQNQPYTPQNLALLIQRLRQDYIQVAELDLRPHDIMRGAKDLNFEQELEKYLLGPDEDEVLMFQHRDTTISSQATGMTQLIGKVRSKIQEEFQYGYAVEIIENILARAIGQELGKLNQGNEYKMKSTANDLQSSHIDTRLADIEITYVDKNSLDSALSIDSKSRLDRFHITGITDLKDRLQHVLEPYGPTTSYHNLTEAIYNILKQTNGLKLLSQEEIPLGNGVYDLHVTYGLDPIQAGAIAVELLNDKYGLLTNPLLFTSYADPAHQQAKTFAGVLQDLQDGQAYVDFTDIYGGSSYSIHIPGERDEALRKVEEHIDDMINEVALWYGRG